MKEGAKRLQSVYEKAAYSFTLHVVFSNDCAASTSS